MVDGRQAVQPPKCSGVLDLFRHKGKTLVHVHGIRRPAEIGMEPNGPIFFSIAVPPPGRDHDLIGDGIQLKAAQFFIEDVSWWETD